MESFLSVLSVLTARQTRKLPITETRTSRTRRSVSSQDRISSMTEDLKRFEDGQFGECVIAFKLVIRTFFFHQRKN